MNNKPLQEARNGGAAYVDHTLTSFTAGKKVGWRIEGRSRHHRQPAAGETAGVEMTPLPDDAVVVRGGLNRSDDFAQGSGVTLDATGKLDNVSVNAVAGLSLADLTKSNLQTGYPGVPHRQVGVTTVGMIRAAGGEVVPKPTRRNPYHAVLKGLTPDQAARLFRPTVPNPSRSP